MKKIIDVHSRGKYPANKLSNFFPHRFIFDKIVCCSPEGLLQALKINDFKKQKQVCKLSGKEAKEEGLKYNDIWKETQILWWRGKSYRRDGLEYQKLLDRIYKALSKNFDFQKDLLATGDAKIIHSIGESDLRKTILTEEEFCSRLTNLRTQYLIKEIYMISEFKKHNNFKLPLFRFMGKIPAGKFEFNCVCGCYSGVDNVLGGGDQCIICRECGTRYFFKQQGDHFHLNLRFVEKGRL